MLKLVRSRAMWLDYGIAALAAVVTLATAQYFAVATVQGVIGWAVIALLYGLAMKWTVQFSFIAAIILGAAHKEILIPLVLVACCAAGSFIYAALLAVAPPHLVQVADWYWYLAAIVGGPLLHLALISLLQPLRVKANSADIRDDAWLSIETPRNDDGSHTIYRSHKHVRGDVLIIAREDLGRVCNLLGMALIQACAQQRENCDKLCDEALPDLHRCGYLGVLKVKIGYMIIEQSAKAHGIDHLTAYAGRMMAQCDRLYGELV